MERSDLLIMVPAPSDVRRRLAQSVREADVLRRLLKVAEYAARELQTEPSLSPTRSEGASNAAPHC